MKKFELKDELCFPIVACFLLFIYTIGAILFLSNMNNLLGIRKERAMVVEVDGNYHVVETEDGNLWSFYDDRTYFPNDTVVITFDTQNTVDIYDDEIISVR